MCKKHIQLLITAVIHRLHLINHKIWQVVTYNESSHALDCSETYIKMVMVVRWVGPLLGGRESVTIEGVASIK